MRLLIQRVSEASVTVAGACVGKIGQGLLIFIGVSPSDDESVASSMAEKSARLRIFEDASGKMNLSLADIGGSALIVSQFTLYGDASRGRRPDFTAAARPEKAQPLYERFIGEMRKIGIHSESGVFGAEMKVSLLNDGPVTIILENRP